VYSSTDRVAEAHVDSVLASLKPEEILKLASEYQRASTVEQRQKILQPLVKEQEYLENLILYTDRKGTLDNLLSGIIFFIKGQDIQAGGEFENAKNILMQQSQPVAEKEFLLGLVYIFCAMINKRLQHHQQALELLNQAYACYDEKNLGRTVIVSSKGLNLRELRTYCNRARAELLEKQLADLEFTEKDSKLTADQIRVKGANYYALWLLNSNPENLLRASQYHHSDAIVAYSKITYGDPPKDEKQLGISLQYYQKTIISLLEKTEIEYRSVIQQLIEQMNAVYLESLSFKFKTPKRHIKIIENVYSKAFVEGIFITVTKAKIPNEDKSSDLFFLRKLHARFASFMHYADKRKVDNLEEIIKQKNEEIIVLEKQILDCHSLVQTHQGIEKIRNLKALIGFAEYQVASYYQNQHRTGNTLQWLLGIKSRSALSHLMSAASKFCMRALPEVITYHEHNGNILRAYLWSMNYLTEDAELSAATKKYKTLLQDTLKDRYKHRIDAIAYCDHLIESGVIKPGQDFLYSLYIKITSPNLIFPQDFLDHKNLIIDRLLKDLNKDGLIDVFNRKRLVETHCESLLQKELNRGTAAGEELNSASIRKTKVLSVTNTASILQRVRGASKLTSNAEPVAVVCHPEEATSASVLQGDMVRDERTLQPNYRDTKKRLPKIPPLDNPTSPDGSTSPIVDERASFKH
jgi:hypothetical protein